jgi:hypothetical protein
MLTVGIPAVSVKNPRRRNGYRVPDVSHLELA